MSSSGASSRSSETSDHLSNIPDSASDLGIEMEKKRKERAAQEGGEGGDVEAGEDGPSKVKGQKKKKKKCMNPYKWFHIQTIDKKTMIFLWGINFISLIICLIIAIVTFYKFIERDTVTTQNAADLFIKAIMEDLQVLEDYCQQYSNWDYTAQTFARFDENLCNTFNTLGEGEEFEDGEACVLESTKGDNAVDITTAFNDFFDENFLRYGVWRESNDFNIVAFYDKDYKYVTGAYFPPCEHKQACKDKGVMPPYFTSPAVADLLQYTHEQKEGHDVDYAAVCTPEGAHESFLLVAQKVRKSSGASTTYGYMLMGTSIAPRIVKYAETATVCAAHEPEWSDMKYGSKEEEDWSATGGSVVSLTDVTFDLNKVKTSFDTPVSDLEKNSPDRYCPTFPYSESDGDTHMSAFLKVKSPLKGLVDGPVFRIDRPRRMTLTGSVSVFSLVGCLAVLYLIVPIPLAFFIKKHLLERIRNLTNFLAKLTQQEKKLVSKKGELKKHALSAHMDRQISMAEKESSSKGHSSGASEAVNTNSASGGSSTREYTTSSGRTSSTSSGSGSSEEFAGDDIHKLHKTLNDNILGMERRYYATVAELDKHRAINENFHTALRMMNMFCGRENFLMDVGEYRDTNMKMPESFEDFLKNPISIEFLKIHCRKENSLENLLFLLDVSWLEELEYTESAEDDPEIQEQLHGAVVSSAENILAQYIVKGAPMEINVSSGVLHKLRRKGLTYMPMMFADAVKEVKLMMNTDVIFRFRKTPGYEAMCDVLYVAKNGLNFGSQGTVSSSSGSAVSQLSSSKDGSISKDSAGHDTASWKGHLPGGYSVAGSFAGLMNSMIATGTAARGRVAHEAGDSTSIFAGKFHH